MLKHCLSLFVVAVFFILSSSEVVYALYESRDLNSSDNYHVRFDGSMNASKIGLNYNNSNFADIDGNGLNDVAVCEPYANYNGTKSGSCYVIYDSILSEQAGTGNGLDMGNPDNYSIRFDGPTNAGLGYATGPSLVDVNGNGKVDLLLPAYGTTYAGSRSGSFYVIFDDLLETLVNSSVPIDLSDPDNFSIRYDCGISSPCEISESFLEGADIDGNGFGDLVVGAMHCGVDGRSRSGCLIVIFNSLIAENTGTGNIITLGDPDSYNLLFYEASGSYFAGLAGFFAEDLDNNGSPDIIIGSGYHNNNSRAKSGSVYVIYNSLFRSYTGTNNTIDLSDTDNFNIRLDGVSANSYFSHLSLSVADVTGSGKKDIIAGSHLESNNSKSASGSVYIISDEIMDRYKGVGNTLDMALDENYMLRIDGPTENAYIGYGTFGQGDINNNGVADILITSVGSSHNSRSSSGSVYLIYDDIITAYSGSGNTLDLTDEDNYSLRFDGGSVGDHLGWSVYLEDVNNDGHKDLLISAYNTDFNGKSDSGSWYVIYSFPHEISQTSVTRSVGVITIKGVISAAESIMNISGIQYKINSNNPLSGWSSQGCIADDGDFDSKSESFTCIIENATVSAGSHKVYLRAYDQAYLYTPQSNYLLYEYTINDSKSALRQKASSKPGPQIAQQSIKDSGGVFTPYDYLPGNRGAQKISVIIEPRTFNFDAFLSSEFKSPIIIEEQKKAKLYGILPNPITNEMPDISHLTKYKIQPNTITAGDLDVGLIIGIKIKHRTFWQIGSIYNIWYKSYAPKYDIDNAAHIIPELQDRPSIIALSYDVEDLIPPGQPNRPFNPEFLKLAHSIDGATWKILPTSVVDPINKTVAALHKVGGYYMIVANKTSSLSGR